MRRTVITFLGILFLTIAATAFAGCGPVHPRHCGGHGSHAAHATANAHHHGPGCGWLSGT